MKYFNVSTIGLRNRLHISLSNLSDNYSVRRAKPHLKFLSGNYPTQKIVAEQSSRGSTICKLCVYNLEESISHVICTCKAYEIERNRIFTQFSQLCHLTRNKLKFEHFQENEEVLCQFLLDPTSLNLPVRVSLEDPIVFDFFNLSRDLCFIIDKLRKKLLKEV